MRIAVIVVGIPEGATLRKKDHVRPTEDERAALALVVKTWSGSSTKVRRAQVLLKADADGPAWTDADIADAFGGRRQTVGNVRERFVTDGFDLTRNGHFFSGTFAIFRSTAASDLAAASWHDGSRS